MNKLLTLNAVLLLATLAVGVLDYHVFENHKLTVVPYNWTAPVVTVTPYVPLTTHSDCLQACTKVNLQPAVGVN